MQRCEKEGLPVPEYMANLPNLSVGLDIYMIAFNQLHSCRQLGMGEGPIPWTAINEYSKALGLTPGEMESMVFYITAMDNAYLEYRNQQNEEHRKSVQKS